MRGLFIVFTPNFIKRLVLRTQARTRRTGCGFLQRAMHPLVPPVRCGRPGSMRSSPMPNRTHHTASGLNPPRVIVANGGPLSVRSAAGRPYSRKMLTSSGCTVTPPVWPLKALQRNKYRP